MTAVVARPSLRTSAREIWASASYGTRHPLRLVLALALAGVISGLGETAIIVLLIALAAGGSLSLGALNDVLPTGTWMLAGLALGAVAMVTLAHWLSARTASRASAEVRESIQLRLVDAWFAAPWSVQVMIPPAELQHLVSVDVGAVAVGARTASGALTSALHLTVVLLAAFVIGPYTVLALSVALGGVVLLGRPMRVARRRLAKGAMQSQRDLGLDVAELGRATRELRVFGVLPRARLRLADSIGTAAHSMRRFEYAGQLGPPLVRDATLALLVVGLAVIQSATAVTLSGLGATVLLLLRALSHAQLLANTGVALQERAVQRERIEAALKEWAPAHPPGRAVAPPAPTIAMEDVYFRHAGAPRDALSGISLEFGPGELVGIIGRSGAGKTTLVSLLLGLYTPRQGRVAIGEIDLRDIDPATWRTAWVGQDPQLLTGTLADNIRLFRAELGDDVLKQAALDAGLGPELASWPDGLEHAIGPEGATLSGGQRQRVAIARALAGKPDVLVLDEPTSALDVHAESSIRDLLGTLRGRVLVLVIAHRLSTLRECDRIAVLDEGRLVRIAPPAELRENEAYFREVLALSSAEPIV